MLLRDAIIIQAVLVKRIRALRAETKVFLVENTVKRETWSKVQFLQQREKSMICDIRAFYF